MNAIMGKYTMKKKNDGLRMLPARLLVLATSSRGGRTLPSENCHATNAGSLSGRTLSTTTAGPVRRMPRNCFPTHNQIGSLVAKCLPLTHVDCFTLAFEILECEAGLAKKYTWGPNTLTVVKTPVSRINGALVSMFGGSCVLLEQCSVVAKNKYVLFGFNACEMVCNTPSLSSC